MTNDARRAEAPLVSVIVPVLDEEECVGELKRRVCGALEPTGVRLEILFIDDGSTDRTPERIAELRREDPRVKTVRFTRPFGHQPALVAGFLFARGDAVISMDGDLEHPPERLPDMVALWRQGADVVQAVRRLPAGTPVSAKERAGRAFYRLINRLSRTPIVPGGADFRLLDRRVVDALNKLSEYFVFLRGMVPWLGFATKELGYEVVPRHAGRSKYSLWRMCQLALRGVVAFSTAPLRVIAVLGALTTVAGMLYGVFVLLALLIRGVAVSGWTSLMIVMLVFGGIQLLSIGMLSEYVGRIFEETKRRPRFVIDRVEGVELP